MIGTRTAMVALISVAGAHASADVYTQSRSGGLSMGAEELITGVGGTPNTAPSVSLLGFNTQGGTLSLVGVELLTHVTFTGVNVDVLNVSRDPHDPLQVIGDSGVGAAVGNQFPFLQTISPWTAEPVDEASLPAFGTVGSIDLVFTADVDLSAQRPLSFYEQNGSFSVFVAAVLDARSIASPDGSLVVLGDVNPASEWTISIESSIVYTYELVPTPGAAALLGLGAFTSLRRRR